MISSSIPLQHKYLVRLEGKYEGKLRWASATDWKETDIVTYARIKGESEKKMLDISATSKAPSQLSTKKSSKARQAPDFHLLVWMRLEVTAGGATDQ